MRYQIYAYIKVGYTQKEIADCLGTSQSTISRELNRNHEALWLECS
jgi:IS30 family transposase